MLYTIKGIYYAIHDGFQKGDMSMKINHVYTPAVVLNLDAMEHNLKKYADAAASYGKTIWPMIKTHKSTELALLQQQYGCTGFLCGTLDEAEALCRAGIEHIMYAYPVAADGAMERVITLSQQCDFYIRLDGEEAARALQAKAAAADTTIQYTLIIDSGLHRFGVQPAQAVSLANALRPYDRLIFKGISTHPGHVYAASSHDAVAAYCRDEAESMTAAAEALREAGYTLDVISSGSTPTFFANLKDDTIQIYHPGNYIFNDVLQLSTETASEEECALYVMASIISHPAEDVFLCDAGSKCLGLDQGAHGNSSIVGFGRIKGHPELCIIGLSEEVGKIHADGKTNLQVGDTIFIIPNHACSTANMTSYFIGIRGDDVERTIAVDMRGNGTRKI